MLRLSRAIAFAPRVFDSRSALVLAWFIETSAISEPEKKAERARHITKRAMLRLSIILPYYVHCECKGDFIHVDYRTSTIVVFYSINRDTRITIFRILS